MTSTLSALAAFDDLTRCVQVLIDGAAEDEFFKILQLQEKLQLECIARVREAQRIQGELDASLQSIADLETKLFHARRLLEVESRSRREAEYERDQMEEKILAIAEVLQYENNLKRETKEKLDFLHFLPRKRKSVNSQSEEKYGNDINSTGSFLSNLSITQSEDDFLDVNPGGRTCYKQQRVVSNSPPVVNCKRSRLNKPSMGITAAARHSLRRSGFEHQQKHLSKANKLDFDCICTTTTVTLPQDVNGVIRAESTIDTVPGKVYQEDDPAEVQWRTQESPSTPKRIYKHTAVTPRTPANMQTDSPMSKQQMMSSTTVTPRTPVNKQTDSSMANEKMMSSTTITPRTPANKQTDSPMSNQQMMSAGTLKRAHNFATKTFLKAETCLQCQKKIRFGCIGMRCRECPVRCHIDCSAQITVMCMPTTGTPAFKGVLGYLTDYAPTVAPFIPPLIVHCVNEIETRGLNEEGLYRISATEREVKALKERFLRGKSVPHLANIDIHVLCGCIKDFLRSLREPLIPTNLWRDFCNAIQNPFEENMRKDLYKAIDKLPQANRDTLAFLILHFQRISECQEVKMSLNNIATVFCPTIVGYSTPDPDKHAICAEVYIQYNVMMNLLNIAFDYWAQFIMLEVEKENDKNVATVNNAMPQKYF